MFKGRHFDQSVILLCILSKPYNTVRSHLSLNNKPPAVNNPFPER